jgi:hypothetical protein
MSKLDINDKADMAEFREALRQTPGLISNLELAYAFQQFQKSTDLDIDQLRIVRNFIQTLLPDKDIDTRIQCPSCDTYEHILTLNPSKSFQHTLHWCSCGYVWVRDLDLPRNTSPVVPLYSFHSHTTPYLPTPPQNRYHLFIADENIPELEHAGAYKTLQEAALWTMVMSSAQDNIILYDGDTGDTRPIISDGRVDEWISEVAVDAIKRLLESSPA